MFSHFLLDGALAFEDSYEDLPVPGGEGEEQVLVEVLKGDVILEAESQQTKGRSRVVVGFLQVLHSAEGHGLCYY